MYPFLSFSCGKWLLLCTGENSPCLFCFLSFDSGYFILPGTRKAWSHCVLTQSMEFHWEQLQPNASTNGGSAVSAGPPWPPTFLKNLATFPKLQTEHRTLSSFCHHHHLKRTWFLSVIQHSINFLPERIPYPSVKVFFPFRSIHMQVRKQQLELDMEQQTGSK